MTATNHRARPGRPWWRAAWPCWLLAVFACLAVARTLPAGPGRAVVAAPILLGVPGTLTLGALRARWQLPVVWLGCLAAVLSMIWAAFASLALYLSGVLITAASTYWCLLLICALLAAVAQGRLIRERPAGADGPDRTGRRAEAGYSLAAVAAGAALLAGGTFGYLHTPRPAPAGYTWIAWSGGPVRGVMPVGGAGLSLPFEIEHQEPAAATFRLTAVWTQASRPRSLARPLTVRIGPDKTVHGSLAIPSPPGGCIYRIVVTLTEVGPADPPSWSVNADVRGRAHRQNACAS
jgi:hypothetical protein